MLQKWVFQSANVKGGNLQVWSRITQWLPRHAHTTKYLQILSSNAIQCTIVGVWSNIDESERRRHGPLLWDWPIHCQQTHSFELSAFHSFRGGFLGLNFESLQLNSTCWRFGGFGGYFWGSPILWMTKPGPRLTRTSSSSGGVSTIAVTSSSLNDFLAWIRR